MTEYTPIQRVVDWLMDGDPAIRWQVQRDLLDQDPETWKETQQEVARSGWGVMLLEKQDPDGKWAGGLYSPKWTSTTYTMLLLRRIGLPQNHPQAHRACKILLDRGFASDHGINYGKSIQHAETCITGMVLSILAYFRYDDERIKLIADHLLKQQMDDGGWNCQSYQGDTHSSFHTTINVLEGMLEFEALSSYNQSAIQLSRARAREFLLRHHLYRSHTTGEIVNPAMTRFSFPPRWHYDVLRALDYFQADFSPWDPRLEGAIELLQKKRNAQGQYPLQNRYAGKVFFDMEAPGEPSRWNTLRALRVLKWYDHIDQVHPVDNPLRIKHEP